MVRKATIATAGLVGAAALAVFVSRQGEVLSDPAADFLSDGFTRFNLPTPPGSMAVFEKGAGAPFVFLHGIGGGASSWTWILTAPAFAPSYRVIVPDWVGWGSSAHPERPILFEDYVASLEALLDHIGRPATVVAQSLACGFAMAVAERRPDLIARLVLHTPSGGKDFGEDAFGPRARATITPFTRTQAVGSAFYRLLFHRRTFIGGWLRREGFADASAVSRRIVDAFLFNARREGAVWSVLPFANGELRYDIAPLLSRMRTPAAILWGAEESQVTVATGRRLAALRPDIPFETIAGTKACPELERPEAVIDAIRTTLD